MPKSPRTPNPYACPEGDPHWDEFMAHAVIDLIPRDIPHEKRVHVLVTWLSRVQRLLVEEGLPVPAWVHRAIEMHGKGSTGT